jgi:carbonic anhydrase
MCWRRGQAVGSRYVIQIQSEEEESRLAGASCFVRLLGMSVIDEVLQANEIYSRTHELRRLTPRPERKLAVLTCMDTRLSIRTLGLKTGDAHIIRNAGGIVTDDSLRSLLVSHYLLGTEEFMVINHTDCGLMHTTEQDLRTRIQNRSGTAAMAPAFFYAFANVEENVRHQLQKLRTHPWIPKEVAVRGFVYDVTSGFLREITG